MKTNRTFFIVLGSFLIVANLLTDVAEYKKFTTGDASYNVGYFIGAHIMLFIGLVILLRALFKRKDGSNGTGEGKL